MDHRSEMGFLGEKVVGVKWVIRVKRVVWVKRVVLVKLVIIVICVVEGYLSLGVIWVTGMK